MIQQDKTQYDYVLIGAGLANCFLALKLQETNQNFILIEQKTDLHTSQTWSFHNSDITVDQRNWLTPVIGGSWPSYDVHFTPYSRKIPLGYSTISSETFFQHVKKSVPSQKILLGRSAKNITEDQVTLADGKVICGKCIIAARGLQPKEISPAGYQKFVGIDLHFEDPHGLQHPIVMDARVPQTDGFRFMYCIPWDQKRILIEDTHYSETSEIDQQFYRQEIIAYAKKHWGQRFQTGREEAAALPIPLTGNIFARVGIGNPNLNLGLAGGYFHPTTGYSLPWALQNAFLIANLKNPTTKIAKEVLDKELEVWKRQSRYFLFLNRMMFGAALPNERVRIFSRFYRFSSAFISRFYGARLTPLDQARLLMGRPPVRLSKALKSILTTSWMESFNYVQT